MDKRLSCEYRNIDYRIIFICNTLLLKSHVFGLVKLNGGRHVIGILRGFDPFMNMVIDESIEECKDGTKNNIGMVVS